MEFVRVNRPASDMFPVAPARHSFHTVVSCNAVPTASPSPFSWFLTTSTVWANWKVWVYCAPVPDRIRWISITCALHPKILAITRFPNQRSSHPSKISPR